MHSNFPYQVRNCSPETIEKLSENGSDDILAGLSCRGSEDSGNEDIENRWVGCMYKFFSDNRDKSLIMTVQQTNGISLFGCGYLKTWLQFLSYPIVNVNRSFKLAHFTRLRLLNAAVSATTGTAAPNLAGRTGPKSSGNGGGPVKPSKKNRASKLARLRSMSCFKCSIYKDSLQSARDK